MQGVACLAEPILVPKDCEKTHHWNPDTWLSVTLGCRALVWETCCPTHLNPSSI